MSTRKIVGSVIVEQRRAKQSQNNLWYYVTAINSMLENNPINADESIDVEFFFGIDSHMIDQITETYENEGWSLDVGVTATAYENYSGHTQINFIPVEHE